MNGLTRVSVTAFGFTFLVGSAVGGLTRRDAASKVRIVSQIQSRVSRLPGYGVFDHISLVLRGATVTLGGFARRPALKQAVEGVVRKVRGVTRVINEVQVLPLSESDATIRNEAYGRLYSLGTLAEYKPTPEDSASATATSLLLGLDLDPPRGPHPIHIIVKDGKITLEGVVESEDEKIAATLRALTTRGVSVVENNLVIS